MYYYIEGKVALIEKGFAVLDNRGIGYRILAGERTLAGLRSKENETVRLYTYYHVKEDGEELYGFPDREEKHLFELLIGISGVGPKAALAVLSALDPDRLVLCVLSDDAKAIAAAPGIGLRTAQKIILEIKDKLKKEGFAASSASEGAPSLAAPSGQAVDEAVSALESLGYGRAEALRVLRFEGAENLTVEELIRRGLKNLTR